MTLDARNKHATRSARTRERFIEAAEQLFAERSIDSVSLNEITVAAGQKNRNALQYHFGNRDGLLQAIIDSHVPRVSQLREHTMLALAQHGGLSAATIAARALVDPLTDYVAENSTGIYYVKILSQLVTLNSSIVNPAARSGLTFHKDEALGSLMRDAVAHLKPAEAQRRMFLTVSITFHGIADICRANETGDGSLKQRAALFEQVTLAVASFLSASPVER